MVYLFISLSGVASLTLCTYIYKTLINKQLLKTTIIGVLCVCVYVKLLMESGFPLNVDFLFNPKNDANLVRIEFILLALLVIDCFLILLL